MLNSSSRWLKYTHEVLAWSVNSKLTSQSYAYTASDHTHTKAMQLIKSGTRRNVMWYILLGSDKDGLSITLSQILQQMNISANILLIEDNLDNARHFYQTNTLFAQNVYLLADTSPWALFLLSKEQPTARHPVPTVENSLIHWIDSPENRSPNLITWRRLFLGAQIVPLPTSAMMNFKLSVGAIIHPHEPNLHDFFAQIPPWVHELVVVWDTENDIESLSQKFSCATKVHHFARSLNGDFSAQRNDMLSKCTGQWLLYLDADERLAPNDWEKIPYLVNLQKSDAEIAFYFPRLTFERDDNHIRMGHGLWPDIQLRLFPIKHGVHFVGSVHEQVAGLAGNFYLASGTPILHYSHIHKNAEELQNRLAIFNAAGSVKHKLSSHYPCLERDFFEHPLFTSAFIFQLPS